LTNSGDASSGRRTLERLVAAAVAVACLAIFLNGSFVSSYGAAHVDLSINLTAAHSLRAGENPYDIDVLRARAESRSTPTAFIYRSLFTSYIQPPTSAMSLLPLTWLPWRDATRVYLVLNHLLLFAAVGLALVMLKPALPWRWVVAGASLLLMLAGQILGSFALGQVDASVTLLLVLGFWGLTRSNAAVAGSAVALAAAMKLIPALLVLYFIWKREYRAAAWAIAVGGLLFIVSLAYAGTEVWDSYLTQTLPALTKGSTHYTNIGLGAATARWGAPEAYDGVPGHHLPE
jgi:hypothetical protein